MNILRQLWHSPVLMTWGNLLVKSSALVVLLPLVVAGLESRDGVIWFGGATLFSFQLIIDFGLTPTITRYVSYAYGGVPLAKMINDARAGRSNESTPSHDSSPDWAAIAGLSRHLRSLYRVTALAALGVGVVLVLTTLPLAISQSSHPAASGIALSVVLCVATINVYGNSYVSLLQGCGQLALTQRVQMTFAFASIVLSAVVLASGHGVASAIVAFYLPYAVATLVLRRECRALLAATSSGVSAVIDTSQAAQLRRQMAGDALRSGVGVLLSLGIIQLSGLVTVRLMTASMASAYMLGLQMIRAATSFSQAPFHAHFPHMASLYYIPEKRPDLLRIARTGMVRSLLVFLLIVVVVGLLLGFFHTAFGKRSLPSLALWGWLGMAFLVFRFGAMYLQLYTLTGHVVWHLANGGAAVLMLGVAPFLYPLMGGAGFAAAMLVGYAGFYMPYSVIKARRSLSVPLVMPSLLLALGIILCTFMVLVPIQ